MEKKPPTWAQPRTLSEWRRRIVLSMGGPAWNAEVTEEVIEQAIWETLSLFNKYRPVWRWRPLGLLSGSITVDFSDTDIGVNVKDVKFMRQTDSYGQYGAGRFNSRIFSGMQQPRRQYKQAVAYDNYDALGGTHPDYKYDAESKLLSIIINSGHAFYASALLLLPNKIENIHYSIEIDFFAWLLCKH